MNQETITQEKTSSPSAAYYPTSTPVSTTPYAPTVANGGSSVPSANAANGAAKGTSNGTPNGTTNGSSNAESATSQALLQPIEAQFYNVARNDGSPMAGLVVLVDSKRKPVRAELHLHEGVTDEAGRQAIRQAQHIIEDRYTGPDAIPMDVWQSFLRSDRPLPVQLNPAPEPSKNAAKTNTKTNAKSSGAPAIPGSASPLNTEAAKPLMIVGGGILLLVLIWGLWSWFRPSDTAATPESGGIGIGLNASDSASLAGTELTPVDAAPAELAVSRNADPNISLGKRVVMTSASQPVRSEAGANAGAEIGSLNNGDEVLVVGGPQMLAGASDTIVWWEVQMANDQSGWVAANTSTRSLLEPLE